MLFRTRLTTNNHLIDEDCDFQVYLADITDKSEIILLVNGMKANLFVSYKC